MKRKVNCGELSVEKSLLGLQHIVKATSETWPNPFVKVNSTLAWSFQQGPCREMGVILNVNFALSSNSKDELRDLYNYLNQKVITVMLGDNLIMNHHQVGYMSSVLIPAEAVENNQEHLVANKVGSITLL